MEEEFFTLYNDEMSSIQFVIATGEMIVYFHVSFYASDYKTAKKCDEYGNLRIRESAFRHMNPNELDEVRKAFRRQTDPVMISHILGLYHQIRQEPGETCLRAQVLPSIQKEST